MPFKLVNHVHEETQSSGTGALNLDGPIAEHLGLAPQLSTGDSTILAVYDNASPPALEILEWTFTDGTPDTIEPTTGGTLYYSTTGSKIDWPAGGTRNVTAGLPAQVLTNLILPTLGTGLLERTGQDAYAVTPITASGKDLIDETSFDNMLTRLGGLAAGITVFKTATEATIRTQLETPRFRVGVLGSRGTAAANSGSWYYATDVLQLSYSNGTDWIPVSPRPERGILAGLTLSRVDGDTISVAPGTATTWSGAERQAGRGRLASAFTKNLVAPWSAGTGNNGLATGVTLSSNNLAHIFLGADPSGAVDVGIDDNTTGTNISTDFSGAGYTTLRRLGSLPLDGSTQLLPFTQEGDEFHIVTPLTVYSNASINCTAGLNITLNNTVVPGPGVMIMGTAAVTNIVTNDWLLFARADQTPGEPDESANPGYHFAVWAGNERSGMINLWPNASRQIRIRTASPSPPADATIGLEIYMFGWRDRRGRDD